MQVWEAGVHTAGSWMRQVSAHPQCVHYVLPFSPFLSAQQDRELHRPRGPGSRGPGQASQPQGCSTMQIRGLQHRLSGFGGPWNLSLLGHLSAPSSLRLPELLECHQSQALLPDQDVSTNGQGRKYTADPLTF